MTMTKLIPLAPLSIFATLILAPALSKADSIRYSKEPIRNYLHFGEYRILSAYDPPARDKPFDPIFRVEVIKGSKILGSHPDIYAADYFGSPDHQYFVGLSNSGGRPDTAIVIMNNKGKLLYNLKHSSAENPLSYCQKSISVLKLWYDYRNPKAEFIKDSDTGNYTTFRIRSCDGRWVEISSFDITDRLGAFGFLGALIPNNFLMSISYKGGKTQDSLIDSIRAEELRMMQKHEELNRLFNEYKLEKEKGSKNPK